MRTDALPLEALEHALLGAQEQALDGLIHHSDRGSQGGFNRSSQPHGLGGMLWDERRRKIWRSRQTRGGSGRRIGHCVSRCDPQGGRCHLGRWSVGFGG